MWWILAKEVPELKSLFVSFLSQLFKYTFCKAREKSPKIISILTRWEESSRVWNQPQKKNIPSVLSLQLELNSPQPSKHFWVLQMFERKRLAKVKK